MRRRSETATPRQLLLTGLLSLLVFALGLVAQVPEWHDWLHAPAGHSCAQGEHSSSGGTHDPSCAVSLLGHGTELPLQTSLLAEPRLLLERASVTATRELPRARDRLQPPGRAPPALA